MRRLSKQVNCGGVIIGGGAPVSIQSMTNVDSRDEKALIGQINRLEDAGCHIVRVAVPNMEAADVLSEVKKKVKIPIVADIHFDYNLALAAIKGGADKIRINPGNIGDRQRIKAVVDGAKERNIPIRVGVNSGSLERHLLDKYNGVTAEGLAESALQNLQLIEDMGYENLVVSIKSSNVRMNYLAHRILAKATDYPIHIGITEAGTLRKGKVKSAIGIGSLLMEGIGDTMRVSLTADPVEEVIFAREILEAAGIVHPRYNLISCPTCGRTKVNLQRVAEEVDIRLQQISDELNASEKTITVAVMGCEVNGPGEAKEADYGICGGKEKGLIFAKGRILETVREDELVDKLIKVILENEGIHR